MPVLLTAVVALMIVGAIIAIESRDLLSAIVYGLRMSLGVGAMSTVIALSLGMSIGVLAAYFGGKVDAVIMRLVDLQMSFPFLLLALLILFALGPGFLNVVLVLALARWVVYARLARGMTLTYRNSTFIDAAIVTGNSDVRIIRMRPEPG